MLIGVPTEIKTHEYRVGMIPAGVHALTAHGHHVMLQRGAGAGAGITNEAYAAAGAEIVADAADVWRRAELVFKVKEPLPPEYPQMRENQIIYTYFHLAAVPELARVLVERGATSVAYETIETDDGRLPLLQPMSAIAGRMAVQVGAVQLEKMNGGKGVLLGGVAGVRRGRVVIIGGGVVGSNAALVAAGMGAHVTVLDVDLKTLEYLEDIHKGHIDTAYSDPLNVAELVTGADLVVGAVLVAGARAPKLVSEALVARMEAGSVIVDVAVDQGGCVETATRPTTHDDPVYTVHGVIHYAVANMPGAVPRTSTYALNNATLPLGLRLADLGVVEATRADPMLARGVNTFRGAVTHPAVARAVDLPYRPLEDLIAATG